MNRREFLFSAGAVTLIAGCNRSEHFGSPDLRFAVVSDTHVTTPKSAKLFEKSLRYFKRRGSASGSMSRSCRRTRTT